MISKEPGLYVWSAPDYSERESSHDSRKRGAAKALQHLQRIDGLRAETVPEVQSKIWVMLDVMTRPEIEGTCQTVS